MEAHVQTPTSAILCIAQVEAEVNGSQKPQSTATRLEYSKIRKKFDLSALCKALMGHSHAYLYSMHSYLCAAMGELRSRRASDMC